MEDFGTWITILFSNLNPATLLGDIIIYVWDPLTMSVSQFPVLYSSDLQIQIILLFPFVSCIEIPCGATTEYGDQDSVPEP